MKQAQCMKAVDAYKKGKFKSMLKCAQFYKVPNSTLRDLVKRDDHKFQGSGRKLACLSQEEECAIVSHVKWRASVGCGVD